MPTVVRLFHRHHTGLLNIIFGLIAVAWLACQIFLPASEQPPILTQALQAVFGVWLTNLAYEQRHKDEEVEKRVTDLEGSDIGSRVGVLEDQRKPVASALSSVIEVQERELTANRAALQLMREAVVAKEEAGVPVLPETHIAIVQLERQIDLLALDVHNRRMELSEVAAAKDRGGTP